MLTQRTWLRVPSTIRIDLVGELRAGARAKDVSLELIRRLGVDGATYRCLEFGGTGLEGLSMDSRFTIANMTMELGAKCCLMPADDTCLAYVAERVSDRFEPVWSDPGCEYEAVHEVDLSQLEPLVAVPHGMGTLVPPRELDSQPIDMAFLGTCTNGRVSDFIEAAEVLRGHQVHPRVRMVVTPGSREVYREALRLGLIEAFIDAGAVVTPPGCGPCVGVHMGVPADGEVVITSANRNFRGRMGNRNAAIYVGSAGTVAASALCGHVASAVEVVGPQC
jgi:homoaconitase/3-isopropylmalate dehydratase large subunit